jgi:hypothetical protein
VVSRVRLGVDGVVLVGFVVAAYTCVRSIESPTYWFPSFVTISGSLAAAHLLVSDGMRMRRGASLVSGDVIDVGASLSDTHEDDGSAVGADGEGTGSVLKRVVAWSLWLVALPVLALVVPFFYASMIWLVAVLVLQVKQSWKFVVPAIVIFGAALNAMVLLLDVELPTAVLSGLG